ncbi:MAG: DUF6691 family protein [Nitrospirota bacterium]|jgi:uncharacterized membrane protein YedE/YeeE|nr:DUF6691 family protein [Nitrospirota bacterium]
MNAFIGVFLGFLFGVGLIVAQMTNPRKVLDFLDVARVWDPSLAFVMGGALVVYALAYGMSCRSPKPLVGESFSSPPRWPIDGRLLAGAFIFGVGWGLGGFCPGPALTALGFGGPKVVAFVLAMILGVLLHDGLFKSRSPF